MKQNVSLRRTAGVSRCVCSPDTRGVLSVSELRISNVANGLGPRCALPGTGGHLCQPPASPSVTTGPPSHLAG